jgi:hypothetical protein
MQNEDISIEMRTIAHGDSQDTNAMSEHPANTGKNRVTVLLTNDIFARLEEYCKEKGYKKSTLAEKLIKDHLDKEGAFLQARILEVNNDQ